MAEYRLNNGKISIMVESLGAELKSLRDEENGLEYMWNADPKYWKRTSPILFPFVGKLKNMEYVYEGKTFQMSQHGFARDMEFSCMEKTSDALAFRLESNAETLEKYPFPFQLWIQYTLKERQVLVEWKVLNTGSDIMYFAIGGHPAFQCPIHEGTKQTDYSIYLGTDKIVSSMINADGLATEQKVEYILEDGALPISEELFDNDALVIEHNQVQEVTLLDENEEPYLKVSFDAPLFGIWSPPQKQAPFVCIEPWYGRCDSENFAGNLAEREWENSLQPNNEFYAKYEITI